MLAGRTNGSSRVMGRASGPSTRRSVPPPRCADCQAPTPSLANLPGAAGLGAMEPPGGIQLDRGDGRARRRIGRILPERAPLINANDQQRSPRPFSAGIFCYPLIRFEIVQHSYNLFSIRKFI